MTAEKLICDAAGIDSSAIDSRIDYSYIDTLREPCKRVVRELPTISSWVGLNTGTRGGQSKSAVDFLTEDGRSISVKTNIKGSDKVCPPEVGQPSRETFELHFAHLQAPPIRVSEFKRLVITKFAEMLPVYVRHLFDCDFLVWIGIQRNGEVRTTVLERQVIDNVDWQSVRYSFTRDLAAWNESTTVKFDDGRERVSLGEFQAHQHRGSYKFRLKLFSLMRLIEIARRA
jgi:hypothetical protein